MESFYEIVRTNPELAIFLTLAIGFYVGSLKIGGFSIGSVVGVLMTGLVIGQIGVPISSAIKSVFFLLFLFAVGYAVGPQFFHGLKSEGLWQAIFCDARLPRVPLNRISHGSSFASRSRLWRRSIWWRLHDFLRTWRRDRGDPPFERITRFTSGGDQRHVDCFCDHIHFWHCRCFGFPGIAWTKDSGVETSQILRCTLPITQSACAHIE